MLYGSSERKLKADGLRWIQHSGSRWLETRPWSMEELMTRQQRQPSEEGFIQLSGDNLDC